MRKKNKGENETQRCQLNADSGRNRDSETYCYRCIFIFSCLFFLLHVMVLID